MSRPATRTHLGGGFDDAFGDRTRRNAAVNGCESLLRAQLRAGAHMLPLPLARHLATSIGLHAIEVRPSTDPTRNTKGSKA